MMDKFQNAVAVVTGGASGIGRGIAESLYERGAQVVLADRDQDSLRASAEELGVHGVVTDVTDPESVKNLAAEVMERYGQVQILCNNAGVGPRGNVADLTLDDWRWIIDVNLWGVIYGMHYFLPHLRENETFGHIVNTASVSVVDPPAGLAPYVASKAGVLGLTEVVRRELEDADSVVGATALLPGPVTTNIRNSLRNLPQGQHTALEDFDLAGKRPDWGFIEPRDVGEQVVAAIEDNAPYVITHEMFRDAITTRNAAILQGITG